MPDPRTGRLGDDWVRANVGRGFSLVLTGDLVVDDVQTPRLRRESPDLVSLLVGAAVTIGNFESTAFDRNEFGGWPEAEPGGSWLAGSHRVAADLRRMGFDMVSRANNHATDWGVAGMVSTNRLLEEAGIAHAGTGRTLSAARAPASYHSPGGRVSLVSAATRFTPASLATDGFGEVNARPGVNGIRTTRTVRVPGHLLDALRHVRDGQEPGVIRPPDRRRDETNGTVTLFGTTYAAHDAPGTAVDIEVDGSDVDAVCAAIRQAKQTSDFVVFSLHTHEPGNHASRPPDFMRTLAHRAIEAGADAVHGHGPHRLRGIEIHCGRPVFYSLGNFFFMENTQYPVPREAYEKAGADQSWTPAELLEHKRVTGVFAESCWYESVVAHCVSRGGGSIDEVWLHPIELHWNDGRDADRGIPRPAGSATGRRILEDVRSLSAELGTDIELTGDGLGLVKVTC